MELLTLAGLLAFAIVRYGLTDLVATVKGAESPRIAERRQRAAQAHERKMARLAQRTGPTVGEAVAQRIANRIANPRGERQPGPARQAMAQWWADTWGYAAERRSQRHERAAAGQLRRQRLARAARQRWNRRRHRGGDPARRPGWSWRVEREGQGPRPDSSHGPDQQPRPQPGPSDTTPDQPPHHRPEQEEPVADRPAPDAPHEPSGPDRDPGHGPTAGPGRPAAGGPQPGESPTGQAHRREQQRPRDDLGFDGDHPDVSGRRRNQSAGDGRRKRIWADAEVVGDDARPADPPVTPEVEPGPDYATGHVVIEGQVEPRLALPPAPEPAGPAPAQHDQHDTDPHLASVHPIRKDQPMTTAEHTMASGETLSPADGLAFVNSVKANQEAVFQNVELSVTTLESRRVSGEPISLLTEIQESLQMVVSKCERAAEVFERHINTQDTVLGDDTIAGTVEDTYVGTVS